MVRIARLVAARPSIGAARKSARGPLDALDRSDRRGEDAGRISADIGGAFICAPPPAERGGGETLQLARTTGGERNSFTSIGRGVQRSRGLHTLYISPLKALAVDIARNLEAPIAEMNLPVKVETRTGDTPVSRRQRQRRYPPDILLTTPEQLALLLSSDDAPF